MKKQFVIYVDVNTEEEGYTGCEVQQNQIFRIRVRDDLREQYKNDSKETILAALLHEMGHALSNAFQLPGACSDFRNVGVVPEARGTEIPKDGVVACEREAWDVAEVVLEGLRLKQEALQTYLDSKPEKWEFMAVQQKMRMKMMEQLRKMIGGMKEGDVEVVALPF